MCSGTPTRVGPHLGTPGVPNTAGRNAKIRWLVVRRPYARSLGRRWAEQQGSWLINVPPRFAAYCGTNAEGGDYAGRQDTDGDVQLLVAVDEAFIGLLFFGKALFGVLAAFLLDVNVAEQSLWPR